jgi:uncharacterized membrane protein
LKSLGEKYNFVAGQNLDRLCAISDGLFSVAMTLLVLDLRVPATEAIHSEGDLWHALVVLSTRLVPYFMCFLTLGIFWIGQQTQLNMLSRADRNLSWIHIGFLLAVSLLPFSTALLATFLTFRVALLVYWFNVLLLGVILYCAWRYAAHAGLLQPETSDRMRIAVERRIVLAQALYAFGAALCVINTYWSIAFIVALQLNYAIAPRIKLLSQL